ncbi:DUF2513 domain-containing protein [Turicibacter sanguinis]|uniref:DUF2513 domain-containing protein n=1 Tax=Turicibacter sanguinis TaxID=154288 RepID=UPI0018A98DBC|nr:DUF2513 domain-containing protein [Turicibacter sanguinis]MDB8552878.1 DUF2513 domain-containing protein [Turicibacter sanguinis]
MRLNPDCIRDILLYVEENVDAKKFAVSFTSLVDSLTSYDENTLHYHVNQIKKANLVDNVTYGGNMPVHIYDLSPKGHEFLENIRSDNMWNHTKSVAETVGSFSLNALTTIATGVLTQVINHQLGVS